MLLASEMARSSEEDPMSAIARVLEGIAITETRLSRVDGEAGEQIDEDRLIRPRVVYVGPCDRSWIPAEARA